jgi:hypothetical protein
MYRDNDTLGQPEVKVISDVLLLGLVVALIVPVGAILVGRAVSGPVSRRRVERFADRQRLVITPDNGNIVIAYLGTTRRWRALGLLSGVLIAGLWSFRDSRISINFLAAFAGWFVGALVAEFRIASVPPGARRAASLEPRLLRRQLRAGALRLPIFLTAVSGVCAVSVLVSADGGDDEVPLVLGYVVAAIAAFVLPVLVGRHVLVRPRPIGTRRDQQHADDALRDRSLQTLAGSSIALAAYPAGNLAVQAGTSLGDGAVAASIPIVGAVLLVIGPICGWLVATRGRPEVSAAQFSGPRPS